MVSRSTYKWYPTNGTHEDSKCLRNDYDWQILQVVPWSFLHVVYLDYHIVIQVVFIQVVSSTSNVGSTSDPQL